MSTYLFVDSLYFGIPLLDKHEIVLPLLLLDHFLALNLHLQELSFALINFIPELSCRVIFIVFLANPLLKQSFLLSSHDSFHSLSSLLHLKLGMSNFFIMQLLVEPIPLFCVL